MRGFNLSQERNMKSIYFHLIKYILNSVQCMVILILCKEFQLFVTNKTVQNISQEQCKIFDDDRRRKTHVAKCKHRNR